MGKNCYYWKTYDDLLLNRIMTAAQCRPIYWGSSEEYPPCSSKQKMEMIGTKLLENIMGSPDVLPCMEIQNIQIDLPQLYPENFLGGNIGAMFVDDGKSWLDLAVAFIPKTFKEIKQLRSYTIQSLIGNAGGYIGLFVGYALMELPSFVLFIYNIIKKVYFGTPNGTRNNSENDGNVVSQMEVAINTCLTNRRRDENMKTYNNTAVMCSNDRILELQHQIDNMKLDIEKNKRVISRLE